ncbi:MAG: BatA domain-containing protein [Thermoguttaceae bacterium]
MTFAAPLFLLAALAAAIPVLMHLIHRRRAKELPFATVRFLKICVEKTRRRKRIHDLLLMALRVAVLALIAIGLARPALVGLGSLRGGRHSAAVLILDNSASMGLLDGERTRFDAAVAMASQILDQFAEGDQVALLPTCGPALPDGDRLDRTQDTVRRNLSLCRVSSQRAELDAKLQQARQLLARSDAPNQQIFVLTDMQRGDWGRGTGDAAKRTSPKRKDAGGRDRSAKIPLIVVNFNHTPAPNVAVERLDVDAAAPVTGLPVKAAVTLRNMSSAVRMPCVELWVDGRRQASSPELIVSPEGRAAYDFSFVFSGGGLHEGEVRLAGQDGSKLDDRRCFAMQVDQGVAVALVRPSRHEIPHLDDTYYLEQALAPNSDSGRAIETASLVTGDLLGEPLDRYKVIFCVNLPALDEDVARRLQAYLAHGGNLVWIAGDRVDPEAYNRMNRRAGGQLLPGALVDRREIKPSDARDSWRIGYLDASYPPLARLVDPPSLYESVLVYRYVRMASDSKARVLARLDDGEPLLTLRKVGGGRTLFLGVAVQTAWTNLPLRPIFLPLLARLTLELSDADPSRHELLAGQPIRLDLPDRTALTGVELVPPGGEPLRLKTKKSAVGPGQMFEYDDTYRVGVYRLRSLESQQTSPPTAYCVNFDPAEADPGKIDRRELEERFAGEPLFWVDNADELARTFSELREGTSLWGVFLAVVLIGLVFETFLSNRFSTQVVGPSGGRHS